MARAALMLPAIVAPSVGGDRAEEPEILSQHRAEPEPEPEAEHRHEPAAEPALMAETRVPVDLSVYSDSRLRAMPLPELRELCEAAGVSSRRKRHQQLLSCLINRRERERKAAAKLACSADGGGAVEDGDVGPKKKAAAPKKKRRKSNAGVSVKKKAVDPLFASASTQALIASLDALTGGPQLHRWLAGRGPPLGADMGPISRWRRALAVQPNASSECEAMNVKESEATTKAALAPARGWQLATSGTSGAQSSSRRVASVVAAAAAAAVIADKQEAKRKAARLASEAGFKASFGSCKTSGILGPSAVLDRERLRVARNVAVARGLDWMVRFLSNERNLDEVADDAPCIYFEMWYTCGDARIAMRCKELAIKTVRRRSRQLLKKAVDEAGDKPQREHFMEAMFMLRILRELGAANGDNLDDGSAAALLELADKAWSCNDFADSAKLWGGSGCSCPTVESLIENRHHPDYYMVVLEMMILEYHSLLWRGRWQVQWGFREGLEALRGMKYVAAEDSSDDFYLVTHIIFALSAYSSIKLKENTAPQLFKYTRRSLRMWLRRAWDNNHDLETKGAGNFAEREIDVDAVAECCDVLRGAGLTEAADAELCDGTMYLLATQKKCGSWQNQWSDPDDDAYSKLHPVWVATQCLRDRSFKVDANREASKAWAAHVEGVLRETKIWSDPDAPARKKKKKKGNGDTPKKAKKSGGARRSPQKSLRAAAKVVTAVRSTST